MTLRAIAVSRFHRLLASVLILGGLGCGGISPARAQVLLPPMPEPETESFEQRGVLLAQLALRQAIFRPDDQFDWEWALPRVQVAAEIAPNSFQTWLILGSVQLQLRQAEEAVASLEMADVLEPDTPDILFALGSAYFLDERYSDTVKAIERGLKDQPDSPEALFDLGNARLKLTQYSKAIAAYEKAFALEAAFWPAINNIGLVLYEQGKSSEAIDKWQASVDIDKTAAEPLLAIAVARFAQGELDRGVTLGVAALGLDARYVEIDFLDENLWGKHLLADTERFFADPRMQLAVERARRSAAEADGES